MDWILKQQDQERIAKYTAELQIPELLAKIILNRDMTIKMAGNILYNSAEVIDKILPLPRIEEAADYFVQNIYHEKRPVEIFADYDCDGLTSGFILKTFCECWPDCKVNLYYPEREEGYGLNLEYAEKLIEKYKDTDKKAFVITVDNGISQIDQINLLAASGFPVLVTDHHLPQMKDSAMCLPNCLVFDPHAYPESEVGKNLCGAAVIWMLCRYIEKQCSENNETPITDYCIYAAALGTISDMMTLDAFNMAIIKQGLAIMNSEYAPPNIKLFKTFYCNGPYTYKEVAFTLTPMLNACGRMGDVKAGAAFFFEDDEDELFAIIQKMDTLNSERKAETAEALKEIDTKAIEKHSCCFQIVKNVPTGLHGLLASKLLNQYNKPVFVVAEDNGILSGSCRSNTIPLPILLQEAKETNLILSYGGHKAAGGISLLAANADKFIKYLDKKMKKFVGDPKYSGYFKPTSLILDTELQLKDVCNDTQDIINMLPYAKGSFRQPVFLFKNLDITHIKRSKNNGENVQISVTDEDRYTKSFWLWNKYSQYRSILDGDKPIDVAATLTYNFQRRGETTLDIIDIKESEDNIA